MTCQTCGRENRPDARFCDACGHRFLTPAGPSGERRQLTVVFCDIVHSMRLAAHADDEDWQRVLAFYRKRVTTVIARWGGEVDFYAGDGVCAYFGYPVAHEDDAERAVRAALDIVAAIAEARLDDSPAIKSLWATLRVRVGIHTGPVVVADLGTGDKESRKPDGNTMNTASRLQDAAPDGTVVMSGATERLVTGLFVTDDLGTPELADVEEPIRAYLVTRSVVGREPRGARYATPLIGRGRELAMLHGHWQQARAGRSQSVLISGEAGIGKSRLIRQFTEDVLGQEDARIFSWRCSPFHTTTPFHPLIGSLEQQLGFQRETTPRGEIAARIEGFLGAAGVTVNLKEAAGSITELVAGDTDEAGALSETPAVRRSHALQLLCDLAIAFARSRQTVLTVEDLHWADASTLQLLRLLVTCAADVELLILMTCRSDFIPWPELAPVEKLTLDALPADASGQLFDAIIAGRAIPPTVRTELLARTDGIPLFIEELTRTLLDCPPDSIADVLSTIPNTLRGLLASRLDRLSPGARETIHLASALSRQFRFELLSAVATKSTAAVRQDLDELVRVGLVFRSRAPGGDTYTFRHALVADAAYDSILRSERRRLHAQIARRLADAFPAMATEQPEILAHHFGEAGAIETAAAQWRLAGDNAVAKGAYQEAVVHFDRGLALADELPGGRERLQLEIELTASKGTALFSMLGYSHPLVESTFARALALCAQDGIPPSLRVLYGVWAHHVSRSNREGVEALLPRFRDLAAGGDPVALLTVHATAGMRSFYLGRFEQCLEEMTAAMQWYATTEHSEFLRRHGYGGGLYPFACRMWTLSILGRREEALAAEAELQQLAEQAGNPYGRAIALGYRLNLSRDRRDPLETIRIADEQIEYARRQLLPMWEGGAHCTRGWAVACLGKPAEGIAEIRLGLQYLDAVGLRATYPFHLGGLVEALLLAGDVDAALVNARQALAMCASGLDRFYEAELIRLEGECLRRLDQFEAAESGFRRGLALARGQAARFFTIHAADSLASLLVQQGRGDLARAELGAVIAEIGDALSPADVAGMQGLGAIA